MKISLVPTDRRFFDLLARSARTLVAGGEALQDFFEHYENPELKAERIRELEHEADFITHEVMAQLHKTFMTPIDREDIANLIQRMDDVMDFMEEATTAMRIYHIHRMRPRAVEVARLMPQMTRLIEQAVQMLAGGKLKGILPLTVEINRLENQADTISARPCPSYSTKKRTRPRSSSGARSTRTWRTPPTAPRMLPTCSRAWS